ncbi:hypothetical protein [Pseudonocardia sediminis]|uniref:hypothetical protein n=1 Tax=Pseudonocardia sediminis TaxID=1397368 RepID=UPI0010293895|nr:hypothetical protein [Pseudonocardia sediminis]
MSASEISDSMVVYAADKRRASPDLLVDLWLAERAGVPRSAVAEAVERAAERGFVERGTSAGTCWPTPAGLAMLSSVTSAARERGGIMTGTVIVTGSS